GGQVNISGILADPDLETEIARIAKGVAGGTPVSTDIEPPPPEYMHPYLSAFFIFFPPIPPPLFSWIMLGTVIFFFFFFCFVDSSRWNIRPITVLKTPGICV